MLISILPVICINCQRHLQKITKNIVLSWEGYELNQPIGFLILAMSFLTLAIVTSLNEIARSIKEAATGSFTFSGVSSSVYVFIGVAICCAIVSFVKK
jgi:hypothetical protein